MSERSSDCQAVLCALLLWTEPAGNVYRDRKTRLRPPMNPREHIRVTGFALKNWAVAQVQDSIAVALLWLLGLWILKVPLAPLWAALAAALQIVPHFGPVLSLVGPVLAALLRWQDWKHPLYVLTLYAVIVVVDGLLLQPYIMHRVAKVPMWASILAPVILGFAIPFWGFILAPPLLAVIYAYKARGPA
jgi:predicted PurR-regulated permease PerM